MTLRTHQLLHRLLADGDSATALLAAVAAGETPAHMDAEQFGAALDGELDARAGAHLLECDACARRLDDLLDLDAIVPFPAPRSSSGDGPLAADMPPVLFATIRTLEGGALDISGATGATRIQPALPVRADRALEAVSLRDRANDPRLEIAVVPEPDPRRFSLLVRWLGENTGELLARASARGRTLAEIEFDGGSALLSNLRKSDVRVDVRSAARVIAVGWLRVEPA